MQKKKSSITQNPQTLKDRKEWARPKLSQLVVAETNAKDGTGDDNSSQFCTIQTPNACNDNS